MKKLLALVLALVMVMSLCVTSNAAFDGEEYDFDEAVEVMAAVGVFEGDENGKFNGKEELTREQAAKLLAYLDLGKKVAESLPAVKVFNDVEADRWSAKYIAYCADAEYLAGIGEGYFAPEAKLTGFAFGKMLLCVLGYDATIEGFVGNNWSIPVAKLMESNDIADGVAKNASAILTREEACQYCLNALKAEMVKYKDKGTGITVAGVEIKTGASDAEPYAAKNDEAITKESEVETEQRLQLGEKLYDGKLKLAANEKDAFGRKANIWTYDDDEIGTYVTETPALTYTTAVSPRTIYNDLGLSKETPAKWFIDGFQDDDGTKLDLAKTGTDAGKKSVGGEGVLTEVYKDSDGKVKVVQVANYLAKITAVTEYKAATDKKDETKASVTLTIYNTDYDTVTGVKFETEAFAKADKDSYVVVTLNGQHGSGAAGIKVQSAVPAETFDGEVSKYTTTSDGKLASVYVDGSESKLAQKYNVNNTDKAPYVAFAKDKIGDDITYTFYTDANGVILGVKEKEVAVSTDYAYVLQVQALNENTDLLKSSERAAKAKVVFTDGTEKTIDLKITKKTEGGESKYKVTLPKGTVSGNKFTAWDGVESVEVGSFCSSATQVNNWYAYAENDDGTYTLKAIDDKYAFVVDEFSGLTAKESTTVVKDTIKKYTNKSTVVTAIDDDNKVTTLTGYPSSKKLEGAKNVLFTYAKDSSVISNIYWYDAAAAVTSVEITYAYAVDGGGTSSDGVEWTFAIDGKQETYTISDGEVKVNNVYKLEESDDTDGTYVATAITDFDIGTVTAVDDSFIVVTVSGADKQFKVDEKTAVYNVNAELDDAEKGFVDSVEKDDEVTVVYGTGSDSDLAKVIYIRTEG